VAAQRLSPSHRLGGTVAVKAIARCIVTGFPRFLLFPSFRSDYKLEVNSILLALSMSDEKHLRQRLVNIALEWERACGVAPSITSAISEFDAARLVGMNAGEYGCFMQNRTAVERGVDFEFNSFAYQVKANRPSGKPGSAVTLVAKAHPNKKTGLLEWDRLIWILYDQSYHIHEAWLWEREAYSKTISPLERVRPVHMRNGRRIGIAAA
jgi:hypothetical protein